MANIFAEHCLPNGRPVTFNAILSGSALGGPKALGTYLGTRTTQITRKIAVLPPGEERNQTIQALRAFEAAQGLIPQLTMQQNEARLAAAARLAGRAAAGVRP